MGKPHPIYLKTTIYRQKMPLSKRPILLFRPKKIQNDDSTQMASISKIYSPSIHPTFDVSFLAFLNDHSCLAPLFTYSSRAPLPQLPILEPTSCYLS